MKLSEFLNYFDFDYEVANGQIRLIDLQGAYLGGIDQDRFSLTEDGKLALVDRLDVYINDYIRENLEERLIAAGVEDAQDMWLSTLAEVAREKDVVCDFDVIKCITNTETLEFEKEKIIESFSAGQMFYEQDTTKYIVLKNTCNEAKDIWQFGVYDKDMQYLYDTTIMDARLANDIIVGDVVSVTDWKLLRLEPHGYKAVNENTGTITASLEFNDFLQERFDDIFSVPRRVVDSAFVKLDFKNDTISFSLNGHDPDPKEGVYRHIEFVVEGTEEDKAMLLSELEYVESDFFKKWGKSKLDRNIASAEAKKIFSTPGLGLEVKKDGVDR